jgi:hypothetical protein
MDFAGRLAAALLVISAAALAPAPAEATPRTGHGCRSTEIHRGACTMPRYRKATRFGALRLRRPKLYRGHEGTITQLSPRLAPRRISTMRFDRPARCHSYAACREEGNLAEAVSRAPDPSTERLLRDAGIPVIRDVPPVVFLRTAPESRDLDDFLRSSR